MIEAQPPDAIYVSLFEHLQQHFGDRLSLLHCTKATLVHLSHTLEDLILSERLPAILFTGFQESSHWREETERYRALAAVAQQVCIFAGGTLPPESNEKEIHVTLKGDDPLRQEWFLCILSSRFSVVLCGQDRQIDTLDEATRQFATLWTLDPVVVNDVLDQCERVVAHYRPERAAELAAARQQFPPSAPDPLLMTRLTLEMISFEEQLHQSLVRTSRLLEQQLRWQDDITNLLVHDLRTPLQSVLLSIQMTNLDAKQGKSQVHLLSIAEQSTRTAIELVQTMLDSTRMEHGQLPLNIEQISLAEVIERAVQTVQALARKNTHQLEQYIAPTVPLVWADAALLQRLLLNLLNNALKFTAASGTIAISAAPHSDGEHIELKVRDTGRGIPADALPDIFNRLAQVRDDDRRRGSGLGLYFCRLAAEALGGSIKVHSQLGVGTTFTVLLPIKPRLLA